MITRRPSGRRAAAWTLFPVLLLALLLACPPPAWAGKSGKSHKSHKSGKKHKSHKAGKSPKPPKPCKDDGSDGPRNYGQVRSFYARRGGLPAESNPTTIPIVDGDFLHMVELTDRQLLAGEAHRVTRGGGVLVAVLDGGFDLDHPDLAGQVIPWGYDAIDNDFDPHDAGNAYDEDGDGRPDGGVGHGTFVCGMVLRAAPEAIILPVRVRDDEGWGTAEELERGLRFAFDVGARVVNISGGTPHGGSHHVHELISAMRAAGVVVVNSAGNEGLDEISEMGFGEDALSVGAVDWGDEVSDFSNRTWDPGRAMVYAPGEFLYGPLSIGFEGSSGYWSGTSFSAGVVSGAVALVIAREPWLDAREVMKRIQKAVDPVIDGEGRRMPHGRVNLWKVVWQ